LVYKLREKSEFTLKVSCQERHDKHTKILERVIGRQVLAFEPFANARSSERTLNALIFMILVDGNPLTVYQLWRNILEHLRTNPNMFPSEREPTLMGIQKRVEDLTKEGFLAVFKPSDFDELPNVSKRALKVYALSHMGLALVLLFRMIREDKTKFQKLLGLKRKSGVNEIPFGRMWLKLAERDSTTHVLNHALVIATSRLLDEIKMDKGLLGSNSLKQEGSYFWLRHNQHGVSALAEIIHKLSLLRRSKERFDAYCRILGGSSNEIQKEILSVQLLAKEDPDMRESFQYFRRLMATWDQLSASDLRRMLSEMQ